MMFLRTLLVILTLTTSSEVRAQAVNAVRELFTPVAFTTFQSAMPDDKASAVIQSLTGHLRTTIVDVYATETIGAASPYSPSLPPAVLGTSGYAMGEIDRTIESLVMPEISPVLRSLGEDERIVFDIELIWADKESLESLPESSIATSALVGVLQLTGRQDMASALSLRWLDAKESDPEGVIRDKLRSTAMLRRMIEANKDQWVPWTTRIKVVIDQKGIQVVQNGLLIPTTLYKNNRIERPGVLIERVTYAPLHFPVDRHGQQLPTDMARVTFKRHYSAEGKNHDSELRIAFGQWSEKGFTTTDSARSVNMVERMPTIHGRVVFSESTWWDSVVGWFRSWFVTEISTKILLQDLSITYDRDHQRLVVDPSKSIIPIVVSSNDVFSGGAPYVLDPRAGVFGINLYERFVGSQIADGLSADLNKTLRDADAALSQLIMGIASGVVE